MKLVQMKRHEVWWDFVKFRGTSWNSMKTHAVSHKTKDFEGIPWDFKGSRAISWIPTQSRFKTCLRTGLMNRNMRPVRGPVLKRDTVFSEESAIIYSNSMRFHEISRNPRKSTKCREISCVFLKFHENS